MNPRNAVLLLTLVLAGGLMGALAETAEDRGGIRGTVVGPAGSPVAGALVSTSFSDVVSETGQVTQTRADGTFRLDHMPVGRNLKIYATAPGFGLGISERFVVGKHERESGGIVVRLPPAASIRGVVTGKAGEPLSEAEVVAYGSHRGLALRPPAVRSDEAGFYAFSSLPSGEWRLAVRTSGHAPMGRVGLALKDGQSLDEIDLALEEGRELGGRVVDAEGRPVAFEPVHLRSLGFPVPEIARTRTRTDEEGRFRFRHLADLACSLTIGSERVEQYRQEVHPDESPLTLRVEVLGDVKGKVALSDDVEFPAAFTVYVIPTGASTPYPTWISPSSFRTVRGSTDGTFHLRGFKPGLYDVIALAEDDRISNRVNRVRIRPGVAAEIETPLLLERTGRLDGRVVDSEGRPVSGSSVALLTASGKLVDGWKTSTDAANSKSGIFQLWGVPPGNYVLRATAPGGREVSVPVEITPGERPKLDVTIR